MAEPRTWTLIIPAPDGRIHSSNADHAAGRWAVARHRKLARQVGALYARQAGIPALGRARVDITIHLRNWRKADATNYPGGATIKAILDGLVDVGVVPSDRPEHMDVTMPKLAPLHHPGRPWEKPTAAPRVVVTITELPAGHHPDGRR